MRIKTFLDTNPEDVERRVNQWLSDHPEVEVVQLAQSESSPSEGGTWSVTLTLLYREGNQAKSEEAALASSERLLDGPVVLELPPKETIGSA